MRRRLRSARMHMGSVARSGCFSSRLARLGLLLWTAYGDWSSQVSPDCAAVLAYFTLFSIAPVLVGDGDRRAVRRPGCARSGGAVAERLLSHEGAQAAELMLRQAATPVGGIATTAIGLVTLFLGTSALVNEFIAERGVADPGTRRKGRESLGRRRMLSERAYAFLINAGAGLLVLASLVVNTTVTAAAAHFVIGCRYLRQACRSSTSSSPSVS